MGYLIRTVGLGNIRIPVSNREFKCQVEIQPDKENVFCLSLVRS